VINSYRAEGQVYNGFCRRYDKIEINSNKEGEDKMVENKNEVNTAFEILLEGYCCIFGVVKIFGGLTSPHQFSKQNSFLRVYSLKI